MRQFLVLRVVVLSLLQDAQVLNLLSIHISKDF